MPDDPLHQANDKLIRQGLGNPETAAGFLSAYLPEKIAAAVEWPKLRLESGSFVDTSFRKRESDLVFPRRWPTARLCSTSPSTPSAAPRPES